MEEVEVNEEGEETEAEGAAAWTVAGIPEWTTVVRPPKN